MDKDWSQLSPNEKRERRFEKWLSTKDIQFNGPEAKQRYIERVRRFIKVIKLEEPDRVPVMLPVGNLPLQEAGITLKEAMYDNEKLFKAYLDFFHKFKGDNYASPRLISCGKASDIMDSKMNKYPGHGLPDDAIASQFVEGEYMKANEYDIFLNDLSDFCFRYYLPRAMGTLEPFQTFPPLSHMLGFPTMFLRPASNPQVQSALQAIIDYGIELAKWQKKLMEFNQMALAEGYPPFMGGFCHAPFDLLGDTLRGTKGIIMDMYRQPDKLHQALKKLTTLNIDVGLRYANVSKSPIVVFPLHKGDDTFMSDEQYKEFYWPTLKDVIMRLVEEGVVPMLFAEGRYNNRLKTIKDLPRGSVIWHFDRTDMFKAKEVLRDRACIMGNVPTSMLITGKPEKVKEYCRQLIKVCGKGGGFILAGGASIDTGNTDNLHAMTEAVFEYGV
jgi:uroporphyrinogen-III decarboxylase